MFFLFLEFFNVAFTLGTVIVTNIHYHNTLSYSFTALLLVWIFRYYFNSFEHITERRTLNRMLKKATDLLIKQNKDNSNSTNLCITLDGNNFDEAEMERVKSEINSYISTTLYSVRDKINQEEAATKKKRGRPRKNPLPLVESSPDANKQ